MKPELAIGVVGGVGLLLLGMHLMTEGLKLAAGRRLREILTLSTRTPLRGVGSGLLVTSLVQSSSAVTVATIGFVNAGLLSLAQAMAVTYGSNVGTTATGWLVAAIGFHVNVKALALPLVGVGMGLRLARRRVRSAALGEALAGFGVFFLGIDALRGGFEGLSAGFALESLDGDGPLRALLFVGLGFLLTLLMQSSSAAIAIVLSAAGGGVVPLGTGAALVIGANIGTTTTAALAVIGATPNARRVAAGHVAFNVLTGTLALLLLPLLLALLSNARAALHLDAEPAAVLAAFHSLFNLLGVALMLPLTPRLVGFLERRFRSAEEDEARPRFLDRNVLETPSLGFSALTLELARVGSIARRLARAALAPGGRAGAEIATDQRVLARLMETVGEYTQRLEAGRLAPELGALLPTALHATRHYDEASELAGLIAQARGEIFAGIALSAARTSLAFVERVDEFVDAIGVDRPGYGVGAARQALERIEEQYQALKRELLASGASGALAVPALVELLDWLSNVRRLAEQLEKASRHVAGLRTSQAQGEAGETPAEAIEPPTSAPH